MLMQWKRIGPSRKRRVGLPSNSEDAPPCAPALLSCVTRASSGGGETCDDGLGSLRVGYRVNCRTPREVHTDFESATTKGFRPTELRFPTLRFGSGMMYNSRQKRGSGDLWWWPRFAGGGLPTIQCDHASGDCAGHKATEYCLRCWMSHPLTRE